MGENKSRAFKGTIGTIIGVAVLASAVGAISGGDKHNNPSLDATPAVQSVTYLDCKIQEIPFETQYEGETGAYGHTEVVKQQGTVGSKKICKPSKAGYKDKVEIITQPTTHIVVRTPKPAPQPVQQQVRYRTGAICRDGWQSRATGRGACSHHGGVSRWLYSQGR